MAREPIPPAELYQRDDQTVHVHLFYNEAGLDMKRWRQRISLGILGVLVVFGVVAYLFSREPELFARAAPPAPPQPAAASVPAEPASLAAASASAPVQSLQAQYARAQALLSRHGGVFTASFQGKRAVLWVGEGATLRQGQEAVTLPRLMLYREALAGQRAVLVELVPESDKQFSSFMACPVGSRDQGQGCSPPATVFLAGEFDTGLVLTFDADTAGSGFNVTWQHVQDGSASAEGRPARKDQAWFDAVVARGSHPVGEPVAQDGLFWQPMLHAPSGVQWDRLTQAPSPEALSAINQKLDDWLAGHVANAIEAASRGKAAQASMRITFASPRWLNVQAALSQVDGERREASETNHVFDVASGKLVTFADGFLYATLKRLDGGIATGPSGEVDQGVLSAALGQMGARSRSRCMQRWLDAHQCSTPANCAYRWDIPRDMTLFPAQDGLAVQFNHWRVAQTAREEGRELPEPLKGAAWDSCVQDAVVIPWEAAKRALRKNTRMDIS